MTHADLAGWTAAALMVCTFSSREARLMRPLAVSTNLAFIVYGALAVLPPVLALHLLLLPINLWRCAQSWGIDCRAVPMTTVRAVAIAVLAVPLLAAAGHAH